MNQGVSAEGLAAADEYLINSGKFSGYTAEGLAAMRPAAWQSWGAVDGKVLIGVETPARLCFRHRHAGGSVPH